MISDKYFDGIKCTSEIASNVYTVKLSLTIIVVKYGNIKPNFVFLLPENHK